MVVGACRMGAEMTFLTDVIQVETTKGGTALELRFSRPVTADDRKAIIDAHNAACRTTPVAPVSPDATGKCGELVAVGEVSTVRESIAAFAGHMLSRQLKPGDLLCFRSQAVELLAAEIRRERDLAAKQLSEVVDRMSDDYIALKAELDQAVGVIEDRSSEYEALEAKLAAAQKALEPFAEAAEVALISGNPPGNHVDAICFLEARAVWRGNPS